MPNGTLYRGEYLGVETLYIAEKIEAGFKLVRDQLSASDSSGGISLLRESIVTSLNSARRSTNARGDDLVANTSAISHELRLIAQRLVTLESRLLPPAAPPVEEPQPVEAL